MSYPFAGVTVLDLTQIYNGPYATFLCAQAFARARIAAGGGGAIINLASTAAYSARIGAGHYAASKAGVVMLTRSLAQEFGPHGIRVNAVAPGFIDVGMSKGMPDEVTQNFIKQIPLGRLGEAKEIVNAILFLASPLGGY